MAASLEANKIVGAILTAGIIASASGNLARILYKPEKLEEPVFRVEAAAPGETAAAEAEAAAEKPLAVLLAAADPDNGAKVAKKCIGCHSVNQGEKDKVGPNLWGILGRPIAAREGYAYSDALKGLDGEWTYESLDAFIADPKGFAPGTKMSFGGIKKAEDRADLIAWLRELAEEPLPLPEADRAAAEEPAAGEAAEQTAPAAEIRAAAQGAEQPTGATATEPEAPAEEAAAQPEPAPAAAEEAAAANPVLAMLADADVDAGAKAARSCKACHSLEKGGPNKVGPPLWDIVGRPVASVEGYAYSDALETMGGAWTWERLEAFLRKPREVAPGTKMSFGGVRKDETRADLLVFLGSLSDDPKPLP